MRFETSKRHNRLLILVPGITALVSTIALSRSCQHSQSWTYLGLLWMMETTAPLTLLLNSFYLYFILVILRTAMLLKLFWQIIVFGFLHVVVYVA